MEAGQDLKLASRSLLKQPVFTLTAALVLGVGIGATSTVVSLANAFMFRPLPVRDGGALMMISVSRGEGRWHALSYPDYLDYREQAEAFAELTGYTLDRVGLSTHAWADPVLATYVPGNFFDVLGVTPAVGRVFRPGEGQHPGTDTVAVLGYEYWQNRFGSNPSAVGRVVSINGDTFTIVGVVNERFAGPYAAAVMDVYLPIGMRRLAPDSSALERRGAFVLRVLGRLAPGTSLEQAQSSLDVVAARLASQYPDTNRDLRARVKPEVLVRPDPENADFLPPVMGIFMALAGLLLLMACFNVANMFAVRAIEKERQLALRAALGASRFRLVRQLLAESLWVALPAAVLGGLFAAGGSGWLSRVSVPGIPVHFDFSLDWRVYAFIALTSLAGALAAGLVPAWRASRISLERGLPGARGSSATAPTRRLRDALVAIQIAGCLSLLVISGLFARSFLASRAVDLGFERDDLVLLTLDPSQYGYEEGDSQDLFDELLARVRSLPGVESAAHAVSVPLGYSSRSTRIAALGEVLDEQERGRRAGYNSVSADYFRTMKIPLIRGRLFDSRDTDAAPAVAVVNQALADDLWPGENPVGQRFRNAGDDSEPIEVVGLVADGKYFSFWEEPSPFFYRPFRQSFASFQTFHVRSSAAAEPLSDALRREVFALAPSVPVIGLMTMNESLQGGNGFLLVNLGAYVAGSLGALAIVLATVGLYGVVSFSAGTRVQEIGIRMAMGAKRVDILRLVMRHGVLLTLVGIGFGFLAAVGLSRLVGSLLVGTSATDPATYGVMAFVLLAVASLATLSPALRATRVDPIVALRQD